INAAPLGSFHFNLYVLAANKIRMLGIDAPANLSGTVEKQEGGSFAASTFSGDYVFVERGYQLLSVGRFTASSSGSSGTIDQGVEDQNVNGSLLSNIPFTGTYAVFPNGRGLATLDSGGGSSTIIFYAISGGRAFMISTDAVHVQFATIVCQPGVPYTPSMLRVDYALAVGGKAVVGACFDTV